MSELERCLSWRDVCLREMSVLEMPFQCAVSKFVANLPIMFSSSKIGRELRDKVRKYISMF